MVRRVTQVDLLVRHRNPQAILIAPSLERLRGYWNDERIASVAAQAAGAAQDWLEKQSDAPPAHIARHATERGRDALKTLANPNPPAVP